MWTVEVGRPIWRSGTISYSLGSLADAPWADIRHAEAALVMLIDLAEMVASQASGQDQDEQHDQNDDDDGRS